MLKRIVQKRFFSSSYGVRTITRLEHMAKAKKLRDLHQAYPEEPDFFIDYLNVKKILKSKELNKAGQKDLVKMEVNRYKRQMKNISTKHYVRMHSQYDIAEKGRSKNYHLSIFSIIFFVYIAYSLLSQLIEIVGTKLLNEEEEEEGKKEGGVLDSKIEKRIDKILEEKKKEEEAKEDKDKIEAGKEGEGEDEVVKSKWSISVKLGGKKEEEEEAKAVDKAGKGKKVNVEEVKDEEEKKKKDKWSISIRIGGNSKDDGKKEKGDGDEKKDGKSSEGKTWLFQDVYNNDIQPVKDVDVKFSDVIGIDEFKYEFEEIVDFLKNPEKYKNAGANIPKGILLVGSPGCGKTLMAKALAGESNCSFFYKSGAEFEEVYVGVGARRIRDLFKAAKKHAPSIIFIDEIDSLAGQRGMYETSENRQCINQMLAEMDGFRKNDSVIVIGATNLEQSLDPAVKRSGRFDKIVRIPLPDIRGREQILGHFSEKIQMVDVNLRMQARRTIGFTGADLKNFINTAILNGVRNGRDHANGEDFDFAYDRIKMGVRRAGLLADDYEKRATAIHEVGHALVCELTEGAMPLYKVTILPSGQSLGHTAMVPEKDMLSQNRKNIEAAIDVALGGRAAEEVFLGEDYVTTGCSSDLQNATNAAYAYVRDLGLMENEVFINQKSDQLSEEYKFKVDMMVQKLLKESLERTKGLITMHRDKVELLVQKLVEDETINAADFEEYLFS